MSQSYDAILAAITTTIKATTQPLNRRSNQRGGSQQVAFSACIVAARRGLVRSGGDR